MNYLASVVSRLYRPSEARQVFALSRRDAEKIPALPSVAVISITTPANGPAALADFEHLLRLSFEDVNHLDPDLSERAKAKLAGSFSVQHAEEIHTFVRNLPPSIRSIVAHCEGGFSRSCAVARALNTIYGYTADIERLSEENPSILSILLASANPNKVRKKRE